MSKIRNVICLISLAVVIMYVFTGCSNSNNSVTQNKSSDNGLYSRERINRLASRFDFGRGRNDVETLILSFVYNDPIIAEKYGDHFCVENCGGMDSGSTFFISWFYEGTGKYFVEIDGDTWWITATKGYLGKWRVTDCYQEPNE